MKEWKEIAEMIEKRDILHNALKWSKLNMRDGYPYAYIKIWGMTYYFHKWQEDIKEVEYETNEWKIVKDFIVPYDWYGYDMS